MQYKQIRAYLFKKSYAYQVFQEYIRSAKRRDKQKIRRRLSKVLLLEYIVKSPQGTLKTQIHRDKKISAYLRIEKELKWLVNERKKRGEFDLDDYELALLEPAIERAAGVSLQAIDDDEKFDEGLQIQKNFVYKFLLSDSRKVQITHNSNYPFYL